MIERYSLGSIPNKPFSKAKIVNGNTNACYEVDWKRDTGSPLKWIEFSDGQRLEARFTEPVVYRSGGGGA